MTKDEAIYELNFVLGEIYDQVFYDDKPYAFDNDDYEALCMAFESLQQPQIIRCKDCKHREAENGFCEGRGFPMQLVPDDGFCDKGERSEE